MESNFVSNAPKTQNSFILNHKTVRMPTAVRGDIHDPCVIALHNTIVMLRIIILRFVCMFHMFQCNPLSRFPQQTMAHPVIISVSWLIQGPFVCLLPYPGRQRLGQSHKGPKPHKAGDDRNGQGVSPDVGRPESQQVLRRQPHRTAQGYVDDRPEDRRRPEFRKRGVGLVRSAQQPSRDIVQNQDGRGGKGSGEPDPVLDFPSRLDLGARGNVVHQEPAEHVTCDECGVVAHLNLVGLVEAAGQQVEIEEVVAAIVFVVVFVFVVIVIIAGKASDGQLLG